MSSDIVIHQTSGKNFKGSTFICGLPGVGLVGNIVANFLVNNLKLKQVGIIDGPAFPSISVVKDGIPNHPMRLYAGEQICNDGKCNQIVICVSDFVPPVSVTKDLVDCIFDWAKEKGCTSFIIGEGFSIPQKNEDKDSIVYGVSSTEASKDWISNAKVTPFEFALHQNYPNPFNPETKIQFDVAEKSHVSIEIFNLVGQKVATLANSTMDVGKYTITWGGLNDKGAPLPSGMYFYEMNSSSYHAIKKLVLVK